MPANMPPRVLPDAFVGERTNVFKIRAPERNFDALKDVMGDIFRGDHENPDTWMVELQFGCKRVRIPYLLGSPPGQDLFRWLCRDALTPAQATLWRRFSAAGRSDRPVAGVTVVIVDRLTVRVENDSGVFMDFVREMIRPASPPRHAALFTFADDGVNEFRLVAPELNYRQLIGIVGVMFHADTDDPSSWTIKLRFGFREGVPYLRDSYPFPAVIVWECRDGQFTEDQANLWKHFATAPPTSRASPVAGITVVILERRKIRVQAEGDAGVFMDFVETLVTGELRTSALVEQADAVLALLG